MVLGGTNDPNIARRADLYDPRTDSWTQVDTGIGRRNALEYRLVAGKVVIKAPADPVKAPEGDYLLFLVSRSGVPSVAKHVHLERGTEPVPRTSLVTFKVDNAFTNFGTNVFVIGDDPALGAWNPARALPLAPTAFPTWTGAVAMPRGAAVTFKFIKKDGARQRDLGSRRQSQLHRPQRRNRRGLRHLPLRSGPRAAGTPTRLCAPATRGRQRETALPTPGGARTRKSFVWLTIGAVPAGFSPPVVNHTNDFREGHTGEGGRRRRRGPALLYRGSRSEKRSGGTAPSLRGSSENMRKLVGARVWHGRWNALGTTMRRSFIQGLVVLGLIAPAVLPGCAAPEEDADSASGAVSESLKERFADLRKVNTDNLSRITVNAGASAVNGALKVQSKYLELGVTVAPTQVFGPQAEDNSLLPAGAKVKGLADIKAGLAKDFGENEFPTQLASARLAYLAAGEDKYYVETGFGLKGALGLSWTHDAAGFGEDAKTSISVGFKKGKDISTRVVVATPSSKLQELVATNGEAIMAMRGFVLPEKSENIKAMKPGEMVALRGAGTFAANFGVGVPILVANAGPFAYTIAVSAGLSHVVEGVLDVQLVRLAKDEVAVEVGISEGKLDARSVGITGSFGVNTVCDDGAACLGGAMGSIVKNGLMSRLNDFLKTSVKASSSETDRRIQLARMRFHLDQPEVPEALAQALHGDLRYAQALYTRDLEKADPPVRFDFDMMRASTTNMRSFGADVFGIAVYHRYAVDKSGSFAVQTPSGVQSVLWSSFQKQGGWFQMDHGQKLTALSSASLDSKSPDKAVNKANLIGQAVVGDKSMDDDVILDSTDALIAMLAGPEALEPLAKYGDAMQDAIGVLCAPTKNPDTDRETWDEACNVKLLQEETAVVSVDGAKVSLVEARKRGIDAFKAHAKIASLGESRRELLAKAAELRLTLQMVKVHAIDGTNGPQVSFALDYRLDDKALGQLANADLDTYKDGVKRYLGAVAGARVGIAGGSALDEATLTKAADKMGAAMDRFQKRYKAIAALESDDLPRVLANKPYIKLPIGIRFDVSDVADADGVERMKQYLDDTARIRVQSMSHQRALLAVELVDALVASASDAVGFGNSKHRLFAEQAAAYTLVGIVPARNLEVGMDVSADVKNTFWMKRDRFLKAGFQAVARSSRGSDVEPISGKMFDLDAMMAQ